MSFTYAELKQSIQDYTENDETTFVSAVPTFIRLAEERLLKNIDLSFFNKNVSGTFFTGNQYLAVPSDYLHSHSLSFTDTNGDKNFLLQKDVSFIQEFNTDPVDAGGPRYYAIFDVDHFIIGPTPDADYSAELHYFYRPRSLTAGAESDTTWLSENAPMALLYGSLVEAYTFMKGEADLIQNYSQRFVEAASALKRFADAKEVTDRYRYGRSAGL